MIAKWKIEDTYILGEAAVNKSFDKVSGNIEWRGNKGKLSIVNPILEGGVEEGKVTVDCKVEKKNGKIHVETCTILISRPTEEEAKMNCQDEIETSYPTEWLHKYGTTKKEEAIKACIEYKRTTRPNEMRDIYDEYLESIIEGEI